MIRRRLSMCSCILGHIVALATGADQATAQFGLDTSRHSLTAQSSDIVADAAVAPSRPALSVTQFSLSLADVEPVTGFLQDSGESEPPAVEDGGGSSETELAKKTQNPVADLITVPFQNNISFGAGHDNDVLWIMNFQPVIPINLNEKWNVINRFILPVIYAPEFKPGQGDDFGLGDLQYTPFLSPSKDKGLIWGVGPVFKFPTATDTRLGSGQWSMGPSAVLLMIKGPWVVGGLAQQLWSIGGDSDRENVSAFLVQPFINYNLPDGWYLTSSPIITANWKADSSEQWTVPLGGGIGKILNIGRQPINCQIQGFYHVEAPDEAGDWSLRVQLALLFPKQ